jgi:hypothetical protein
LKFFLYLNHGAKSNHTSHPPALYGGKNSTLSFKTFNK